MVKIVFISPGGLATEVDAVPGISVMVAAVTHGIDGIEAECGGGLSCGTCHVHVDPRYVGLLPRVEEAEDAMLDEVEAARTACSRLSCQIGISEALEGMVLQVPAPRS